MITINGMNFVGGTNVNLTKIDENKKTEGNAKRLVVDSKIATVSITASSTIANVTSHLHGECSFDGSTPTLQVKETSEEIRIDVKWLGNSFSGQLYLDIVVSDSLYKSINVTSNSGDISIGDSVNCKRLQLKTQSGDITAETGCENLSATTMSGDVEVELTAIANTFINIQTMSGDIDLSLSNVSSVNLSPSTMSGDIKNRFRSSSVGYNVDISASTMSGDIKIR